MCRQQKLGTEELNKHMGWFPVNTMTITRDMSKNVPGGEGIVIVVRWHDDMLGDKERRFPNERDAFEFALKEFKQLCM